MNKFDASKKLCPFSFGTDSSSVTHCKTDGCMLWRWDRVVSEETREAARRLTFPYPPLPTTESKTHGQCGLLK